MSDLSSITNAPVQFGDYTLSPLNLEDWGTLCRTIQYLSWNSLRKLPGVDQATVTEVLKECSRKPIEWLSEEFFGFFSSLEGVTETVKLSIQHKHPDFTSDKLHQIDVKTLHEMYELVTALSFFDPGNDDTKKNLAEALAKIKPAV